MMFRYKTPTPTRKALPQVADELYRSIVTTDIHKSIQCLTDRIKEAILQHNFALTRRCFNHNYVLNVPSLFPALILRPVNEHIL